MKQRKWVGLILVFLLLGLMTLATAETVTDVLGREVTIEKSERIISLTPSGTEILFAIGAGDRVVGVSSACNYPDAALPLPKCGDYAGPNLEVIASLMPDVVIAGNYLQADAIESLEKLGIRVLASEANTYDDIDDSIALIAQAVNCDATATLDSFKAREKEILSAVQGQTGVSCYYAVSFADWGDYSAGPGSFPYDLLTLIGLEPITADQAYAWPMYTLEALVAADPEIVFLACDEQRAEVFKTTPGYMNLTALKQQRVYLCDPDIASRPSPRILDVLEKMAEDAYGISID